MKYTYLLVNLFTISIPFIFSFHPKIRFYKAWKTFFPAMIIVAAIFIVWDVLFTRMGIWSFNPVYVTGNYFFELPLEELLFFICIPYACVFTYYALDKFFNLNWKRNTELNIGAMVIIALLMLGTVFRDRWYTSVTFISTGSICFLLLYIAKVNWFGKALTVYGILLIPFFIVNGVLTGTGLEEAVVMYNNDENLNLRLLTIPVEDAVYGFELFLLNIFFYNYFESLRATGD